MSRLLRNRKTGAVFLYTDALAKHPNIEPYEPARADIAPAAVAPVSPVSPAPDARVSGEVVNVSGMNKAEVIEYAESVYGVDLDPAKKVGELRRELAALIEQRG